MPYTGNLRYDPAFYATHYPRLARVSLSSAELTQNALPEGVLDRGGRITGFVYFEGIADSDALTFTMDLEDAMTGQQFGRVEIPFRVE